MRSAPSAVRRPPPVAPSAARSGRVSWPWIVAAGVAAAANPLLHLPVTDLFDGIATRLGFRVYDRVLASTFAVLGAAALLAVLLRGRQRRLLLPAAALLVALAVVANETLLVASIENIHYPQYALLAFLLGRSGISAEAGWLGATALGTLDEAYQFLVLRRGAPSYLDWNDIVLNAIGAAFGIVALLLLGGARHPRPLCTSRMAGSAFVIALALALVSAPVLVRPLLHPNAVGGQYHVLSATEGVVAIGALWRGVRALLARAGSGTSA